MRLSVHDVEKLVQSHGLKMTPQRAAIARYLASTDSHPTAEEIYTVVNTDFPMTSRATVYNTLNLLKEASLIQEVFEGGMSRFDANLSRHHHFICRTCGEVDDIDQDQIGAALPAPALAAGRVEAVEITLRGVCAACIERETTSHSAASQ